MILINQAKYQGSALTYEFSTTKTLATHLIYGQNRNKKQQKNSICAIFLPKKSPDHNNIPQTSTWKRNHLSF